VEPIWIRFFCKAAAVDPRQVVDRYVEVATADGKAALASLFAPDAVFHAPDGATYHGREQIAAFYERHLADVVPTFHVHRAVVAGNDCWVELADPPLDAPVLLAGSHYTVDPDGLITRLAVYLRPRPRS
jgi:limonene-1,2-epoxide hydrolase